ncbi:MAG: hypothetical protein LBI88_05975, partial [Deltaproteobacteria bacterium]|nr:hypothetical protein [Deltaproteobacteria bacterium]
MKWHISRVTRVLDKAIADVTAGRPVDVSMEFKALREAGILDVAATLENTARRRKLALPYIQQLADAGYSHEHAEAYGLVVAAHAERMAPIF